jgi:small subunit ribosomal protein S1
VSASARQADERLLMSHRRVNSMETMQNYNLGDVVTGVVQSVKPYGAFLDIGGTMGLLHISQITHERLTTVEQVLQVRHRQGHCRAGRTAG